MQYAIVDEVDIELIRESGLFELEWYVSVYPDVVRAGVDPFNHFIEVGMNELRRPGPGFSTQFYVDNNPDLKGGSLSPLLHFLRYGKYEGRKPTDHVSELLTEEVEILTSGMFDEGWYLDRYPDVRDSGIRPIIHYLLVGADELRDPSSNFSSGFYQSENADSNPKQINPLIHYIRFGKSLGLKIHDLPVEHRLEFPGVQDSDFRVISGGDLQRYLTKTATPPEKLARYSKELYSPRISIITPVFNTQPRHLWEMFYSVRNQTYENWELCIVDDASSDDQTIATLAEIARLDDRVKFRALEVNSGISKASDTGLYASTGDYVAFLDHDDCLTTNALSEVVALLREDSSLDYIYSDHTMVDADGVLKMFTEKPSWSPEFLLSTNYIVHFKVVRRSFLIAMGGLAHEVSTAQDLGMSLRLYRENAKIRFLPKILYLWRQHDNSVALSTESKAGIERRLLDTYQQHLDSMSSHVEICWPRRFQPARIGVFSLNFGFHKDPFTTVKFGRSIGDDYEVVISRNLLSDGPERESQVLSLNTEYVKVNDRRRLNEILKQQVQTEFTIVVNEGSRWLTRDAVDRLLGYLKLSHNIGLVGGKALTARLKVVGGGMIFTRDHGYRLICGANFDSAEGHWFNGQIASNVDAVSSRCLAVRTDTLMRANDEMPELQDLFGVGLSQFVLESGCRIVYDPAVKLLDEAGLSLNSSKLRVLRERLNRNAKNPIYA